MFRQVISILLFTLLFFTAFNLNSTIAKASTLQNITENEEVSYMSPLANTGGCNYTMTGYQYHSTINGNTKVDKLISSTGSILVTIALKKDGHKALVQIANSAHLILRDNVYYTQTYSRMFANTGKSPAPIAAERTVTRFYSTSAKTKLMDTKTSYTYSNWYCP